jgi:Tol biopolymer transport system component
MAILEGRENEEKKVALVTLSNGQRRHLGIQGTRMMCAWSPDGTNLAVVRNRLDPSQQMSDILVAPVHGGSPRQLAGWATGENDLGSASSPAWTPDGRHLIFIVHGTGRGGPNRIMTLPVTGGEKPQMLYLPESTDPGAWKLYFSPDGSHIIFAGLSREYQTWMARGIVGS